MLLERIRLSDSAVFDSTELGVDLHGKSVRSGLSTMGAQPILFAIQMAGTIVLARILTPTDYGLIGMVTAVVGFATMFKTFGLSAATQQKREITRAQISGLFWVNLAVSFGLTLCVLASAPLVALFYRQPELALVTAVLSSTFLISGLTVQHDALLRRHMRFSLLAAAQIVALSCGTAVSIVLALVGVGYWALVCGTIATALASAIVTFFLCPWIPDRYRRGAGIRGMLRFGVNVTGFEVINYFSRNLDNILIGRYVGPASLGLYAKAYQLFMLPITQVRAPVTQVALPVLSALHTDPVRYVRYFQRLTQLLATLMVPLTTFVLIEADFLIRVFLGPQWMGAVPLFRILAIAGLVQGVASTRGLVLLTHGYSGKYFRWGLANAVAMIAAFVIGLPFGVVGIAAAYAIANYVILIPSLYYCFHRTPVTVGMFMKTLVLPLLFAGVAGLGAILARFLFHSESVVANLVASAVFFGVYVGLSSLRPVVRDTVRRMRAGLPMMSPSVDVDRERRT